MSILSNDLNRIVGLRYGLFFICPVVIFDNYVLGRCGIIRKIKSHLFIVCNLPSVVKKSMFPFKISKTSLQMCHSGCPPEHGFVSQLYASWPLALNALHTSCDSSQATNIFISINYFTVLSLYFSSAQALADYVPCQLFP